MAVDRVAEAEALVLERPSAQLKDTELLESSERNFVYSRGYKRKHHALMKERVDKTDALADARTAGQEDVSTWMASLTVALQKNDFLTFSYAQRAFTSTPPQDKSHPLSSSANSDTRFFGARNHGQTHLFRH